MSEQNCRRSRRIVKKSPSSIKIFPLIDLTSDNETADSDDIKTCLAHESANLTLHSDTLEKRKCVIEIGESEMVLKLNQKILECIERDDRNKANEYKECLKECLVSFSKRKSHQSDMSPGLATLTNHPSSSISYAHTSGPETRMPSQYQVNHLPGKQIVTVIESQGHPSEKKERLRWTKREEWMLVVGELKVRRFGPFLYVHIKEMFKPELDRFTNTELKEKLNRLKNRNSYLYNTLVKAKNFDDIFLTNE
jgi:hypothetical protein